MSDTPGLCHPRISLAHVDSGAAHTPRDRDGPCQPSPAVLHQVVHDFIQDLFEEGCADPEVFDGLRGQVGQLGHLAHVLWDSLGLVPPLEVQNKRQQRHGLISEL